MNKNASVVLLLLLAAGCTTQPEVGAPPMDPTRKTQFIAENEEQPIHPLYRYAYIADREEGLIVVDVTTLTDGNPSNNFLTRALTFNPDNILDGANTIAVAGRWLFIGAHEGLVVIDIDKPLQPDIVTTLDGFEKQTGIGVQFRYAFVTDANGLHTIDITDPTKPTLLEEWPVAYTVRAIGVPVPGRIVAAAGLGGIYQWEI